MLRLVAVFLAILLIGGCTHIPFKEAEQASLESVDPQRVLEHFKANAPESFQLLNSVVFDYAWQSFMGIGYVDVDRKNSSFKVVCLNPLGVQLFELSGDRHTIVTHNVLPVLMEHGDLPTAVGSDIRKIYFDLIPSEKASVKKGDYRLNFRQDYQSGEMDYEFAGKEMQLVKKTYYEDNKIVWRISYYEYSRQHGKDYPLGIIMNNYKYGYKLTVRQKELYS